MSEKNIFSMDSLLPGSAGKLVQVIAVPLNGAILGILLGSLSLGPV